MRLTRHAWWLYLALMAPITVAYLAGPLNSGPVFNVIGFSACIAIVVGVRRNRPSARAAWYLIALGLARVLDLRCIAEGVERPRQHAATTTIFTAAFGPQNQRPAPGAGSAPESGSPPAPPIRGM